VTRHFGSLALGRRVTNQATDIDTKLFSGVDLRAFWETLRLRWWVIPAVLAVAVGLLWAQESDLRTEPASYFVSRTYEARDPTAVLASVGIDPVSVRAFPDVNNQVLILQSADVREEIATKLGRDTAVTVTRSKPTFTLVDTLESDGQSSFVFQSAGVPTYSFSCNESARETCDLAINAYAAKAADLRTEAFRAGLEDLKSVLESVNKSAGDATLTVKISAIDELLDRLETPLVEVSRYEQTVGATVSSVRRPTYTFAIIAGLIVALLILLQLTYSDRRIRSLRQLSRLASTSLLGALSPKPNSVQDRQVAVVLHRAISHHGATQVRLLPLRTPIRDSSAIDRMFAMLTVTPRTSAPFSELSVTELATPSDSELDVIVVQRNHDLRADVTEVLSALRNSGRIVAGVLLVD